MERGNLYCIAKRKVQVQKHKADSIDMRYRGGVACSSDEAVVMAVERRGHITKDYDKHAN